jgi:hypothetical protein
MELLLTPGGTWQKEEGQKQEEGEQASTCSPSSCFHRLLRRCAEYILPGPEQGNFVDRFLLQPVTGGQIFFEMPP